MAVAEKLQLQIEAKAKELWPDLKLPPFDVTTPPSPEFGDFSTALPLTLAKLLQDKPENIAYKLRESLSTEELSHIQEMTISAPGYLNFVLDYKTLAPQLFKKILSQKEGFGTTKVDAGNLVIEHTSVNPNKAAHIGHLRNACLGDSLARIMQAAGFGVETQNYIDDLGLQVADSVVAFETFGDVPDDMPFDKWMWQIYAKINQKYESNPKLQERREAVLSEMESDQSELARDIVEKIVSSHLSTFGQFGITYDILVYEKDIIKNHLWDKLFQDLKDKQLITQATDGDNQGAWLVEFGESDREDKILVRSNGIPTYTAKDIAYQLWKFGLSTMPGYERKLRAIDKVINVIDNRQEYPQAVIRHVLEGLGYTKEAKNSHHLAYGVVRLSAEAVKTLGNDSDGKGASMSGRSGVGVMINDLLQTAIDQQIKKHDTADEIAQAIAVGSIRYYMLKTRPAREVNFDFDEALRTDGNTGVYLQYAYARCHSILNKVSSWQPNAEAPDAPDQLSPEAAQLIKILDSYPQVIKTATQELDPSLLADFAYDLATNFAKFYEKNPVLKSNEKLKNFRLHLVASTQQILSNTLDLLGIPVLSQI